jgi:putative ABC transport system substrate-binding protein
VLGFCAAPLGASAQPAAKVYRIGVLGNTQMRPDAEFRQSPWVLALRDLGWIEGQNVVFERRASDGKAELLPGLARDLVAAKVDLIATFSSIDAAAVKQATSIIPIVMIYSGLDPVEDGLVQSFARPGGNITGVSRMLAETDAKRLELIKEMLPATTRIGALTNARADPGQQAKYENRLRTAASGLGVELQFFLYKSQADVEAALPVMASKRVQAFLLEPNFFTFRNRDRIAAAALEHRLPGVFTLREYAIAGGLMSYGPDLPTLERQHARYVDRILRGASPGELPIEQPTKFDLMINLKSAKALGIAVPRTLLLRADDVIQ